jgi:amino acid adenylation domain-containing protein
LGIFKAGGTYVPLDAEYPARRLEYMLGFSGAKYLVTHSDLLAQVPATDRIDICIDKECSLIDEQIASNLRRNSPSNSSAYVVFTSGTSGEPKGVLVGHRSLVNLLVDMVWRLGFHPGDALLSVTTPCFDISLLEFLLPLVAGGSIEIANRNTAADPWALKFHLQTNKFEWLFSTPSRLGLLLQEGWAGAEELTILTGGEQLADKLAFQLSNSCRRLWNLYGPTETTILSTAIEVSDGMLGNCIGSPISNTQLFVLNANQELVPTGLPGELYIGGDGLAQGYLGRPDLTAERFVKNPFAKDSNSKLYRTGDLCRWRNDGTLEYLGRIDHQVKLRGFRIELGEIESVLASHAEIGQCVVILREDRPTSTHIA